MFSEGRGDIHRYCGVYSWVVRVIPHHCCEGFLDHWLHNDANVPVVSPSLWCWKGFRFGIEYLHHFVDAIIVGISFDQDERIFGELGSDLVYCI